MTTLAIKFQDGKQSKLFNQNPNIPDLDEVLERLPMDSSVDMKVVRNGFDDFVCVLKCVSVWGKLTSRRIAKDPVLAIHDACSSVLKYIPEIRKANLPVTA